MPELRTHLAFNLRLDVTNFESAAFESTRQRLTDQGIGLTTLAVEQRRDSESTNRIYALHNKCRLRQPPVETRQVPIPRDLWEIACVDVEEALPDRYFVAVTW